MSCARSGTARFRSNGSRAGHFSGTRHRLVQLVRPEADARGHDDPGRIARAGWGSIHLRIVQGVISRRDSAPYSLFSRYWTTSNCSGPTAASSVEPGGAGARDEGLHDALLQELVEAGPELLGVGGIGIRDVGEDLRGEARDLVKEDRAVLGEGVADAEGVVADKADDVARVGLVDGLAVLAEELVRGREADRLSGLRVQDRHVALELAGADAHEGDPVAVPGVHVRLDLEDEGRELVEGDGDLDRSASRDRAAGLRRDRVLEEAVQEELDPEIVDRAAEEDRRLLAGADRRQVDRDARAVQHLELLLDLLEGRVIELGARDGILERGDLDRRPVGAARHALKKVHLLAAPVEHPPERRAVPERPDHGRGLDPEHGLELVQEGDRVAGRPVALVHEREDRDPAAAAHLEELARLRLDALGGVDHHEDRVDRRQHAVGVLREVLVAGRVQQVHDPPAVVELQHGRADRDPALLLELHPVRRRCPLVLPVLHRAGKVDRVAVEQELLRQRRLARVRVRDDREGASARDFGGKGHRESAIKIPRDRPWKPFRDVAAPHFGLLRLAGTAIIRECPFPLSSSRPTPTPGCCPDIRGFSRTRSRRRFPPSATGRSWSAATAQAASWEPGSATAARRSSGAG